jgi:hypothetical protein
MKTMRSVAEIFHSNEVRLVRLQKLMGRLNHVCQMCDFLKNFTAPLNESFAGIPTDAGPDTVVDVSNQAKADLKIWAGFLVEERWLPIQHQEPSPPRYRKEVTTDAAGLPEGHTWKEGTGCGGVGLNEDGTVAFAFRHVWSESFLNETDEKGTRFGDKTTCLEALGVLLPFLTHPEYFKNSNVVVKVDCLGVVFGMWNKHATGDKSASIVIRAIHLIATFLECRIFVDHLPRKSDWDSDLADRLTRSATMTVNDRRLVSSCKEVCIPTCLRAWFSKPVNDWSLALKLMKYVMYHS